MTGVTVKVLQSFVWRAVLLALLFFTVSPNAYARAAGAPPPPAAEPGKSAPEPAFFGAVLGVDVSANAQTLPAVDWSAPCDEFLVADQSFVNGADNNLMGRYVASSGLALGAGPFALTANPAEQRAPALAAVPTQQRFLVVWMDNRTGNWDIFARLWDCRYQPLSPEIQLTFDGQAQVYPDVVCGYDLCWVVWQDLRAGNWDIYGQRLNTAGGLIGANLGLSVDPARQGLPALAHNPSPTGCSFRSFLAVWQDDRNFAATRTDVYGQQLDNFGLCGANLAISVDPREQYEPDVAYGTVDNQYQVVWSDYRSGAADVYGVMTWPSGAPVAPSFGLAVAAGDQARPAVAFDGVTDQFLTVWQANGSGNWDIVGQRTTGLGAPLAANFVISAFTTAEYNPAVAFAANTAHYFVAWDDKANVLGRAYWP